MSRVFSRYTHEPECVNLENTSDKWDIPWYTTRKRCITILYHAIENTEAKTLLNFGGKKRRSASWEGWVKYRRQFSYILIGFIFYGMV